MGGPETILLVGGPANGQRVSHTGGDVYTMCELPPMPLVSVDMDLSAMQEVTFTRHTYIRQRPSSTFHYAS